ncbi:MAG: adenylyl-sulfate kinase, partial [Bacteroidales bacterium]|nr:adenylyl-sulfate kinase [Bacteroidales bacterium]
WYMGGPLLNYLENVQVANDRNLMDFRFPVQHVLRPNASFRGYVGSIASGILRKGDEIVVLPSHQRTRIKSIDTFDGSLEEAFPTMPVVLTMESEVDISRGMVLAKPNNMPAIGNVLESMVVWMDEVPLQIGAEYLLKCNTQNIPVRIRSVRYKYNVNELTRMSSESLNLNEIGRVEVVLQRPLIYDSFRRNKAMGAFILIDRNSNATSGGGIILDQVSETVPEERYIFSENSSVSAVQRQTLFGHKPATIWLTGLSGSGKSTIAKLLEAKLLEKNIHTCILDGDNLRHGLNSDLGFSPEDRAENIRRVAEVAKLMNDAGLVVIAAFVSPYRKDRTLARKVIGEGYVEVFVDADVKTCRKRDPKGLYAKFDAGKFTGLTGVDAPYEVPEGPALRLKTEKETVEQSVEEILKLVTKMVRL